MYVYMYIHINVYIHVYAHVFSVELSRKFSFNHVLLNMTDKKFLN